MKIMSVDYGDGHTGLACCDKNEVLATPLCIIDEWNFEKCAQKVAKAAEDNGAEMLVVGNPINMNGTVGPRSEKCQQFTELLKTLVKVPVEMWDERGTTVTAHQMMNEVNKRGKKRKAVIDAVAAAIILENYLAYRANQKEKSTE